ncbi:fimbria/pilus outer membrane usher protein [Kalamiella sp. sgz302252]|uniref:fimbria/pilus outer membrane usher protein n=1 Tax=Pantoea sp. sgz302252 TaxID=3341827 RepID=UPI0036D315D9
MSNSKSLTPGEFRYAFLACLIAWQLPLFLAPGVQAREYFNPALLELDNPAYKGIDLSGFEEGVQAPGAYLVDVYLNGSMVDTLNLDFFSQTSARTKSLHPCLNSATLRTLGVKVEAFPAIGATDECVDLPRVIPQASATFRFNQQRLDLSIPQAALQKNARGYVPPSKWDQGIPAMLLNYTFSGANTYARQKDFSDSHSWYMNLRSGLNIGAWRLRNYSTWNRDSSGEDRWRSINTYAQRDIIALKSKLILGESSSPGEVFDSVSFRGALLASDDDMLPESLKGYSPVVRGIARSNAQVTIRQNGYIIYQSYVAPGAFEIRDLYPTASSGDLYVTIRETDGSEQNLTVPFASVPVLQREGRLKYSLTGGEYRSSNGNVEHTPFSQGTAIYGLPWGATIYGGWQAASKYQSVAVGWGQNLGAIGALSADITQAWATQAHQIKESGQSWRMRYGKNFIDTGTNFSLASYRYSTKGFYTLQETLNSYRDSYIANYDHKKSRAEMTLSQSLWRGAGSLSLNLINEDYWNNNRRNQSVALGYNNSLKGISYGLNYTYSKNGYDSNGDRLYYTDRVFAFNLSIPLSKWLPNSYATYSLNTNRQGATSNRLGLNGTALPHNNLSYSVSQGYTSQGTGASGSATLNYRGGSGSVNLGYSYDRSQQQFNYGLNGGVLVHEDGVTFSQSLGETVVLVKAPGAKDVTLLNQTGVITDWRGYAVVPYASVYRKNSIGLDTTTLPDDVDMTLTKQTVVPTRGAVVRASFNPNIGQRVLMTLLMQDGAPVPFGASVTPAEGGDDSIVGDGGQVYLTGMAGSGTLQVKWGNSPGQQCHASWSLPKQQENIGILLLNSQCI